MVTAPVAPLLLTLGWLLLPGLAVGALLGLRGWLLAGAAPALTMGFVATAATVLAGGDSWGPGAVVALLAVLLAVLAAVAVGPGVVARLAAGRLPAMRLPTRRRPADGAGGLEDTDGADGPGEGWRWWHHVAVTASLLVGGTVGARAVLLATHRFTAVNQTWDALFHFGAVRLITESGDPDPAALAAIGAPASTDFYMPDAYHCLAALVYRMSGADLVTAVNATTAAFPMVLGLGVVGLLRVATGRPAHAVCAGFLAAVVAAVPYQVIGYGTLIPYAAALVLLPGVLALVTALLLAPGWRLGVALGVAAAGVLHTHPQVAFLAAVIALVQLLWHVGATRRLDLRLLGGLVAAGGVAAALGAPVLVALTSAVGEADFIDWPAYTTPAGAVGDLLLFSAVDGRPQWWLVPFLLAGLAAVVAGGAAPALRPMIVAAGIVTALYVLAGAYDTPLAQQLTSLWWNDRHRLAAAFGVLAIVLVAVGAVWLRDQAVAGLRHRDGGWARAVPPAVLVAGLAGFSVLSDGAYVGYTRAAVAWGYGSGPTLSVGERAGLADVARIVAAGGGGAVMNDPHDGCGWAYALHGTDMVFPTPLTGPFDWTDRGLDRLRLHDGFDRLDDDPVIRADAKRLGVRWAVLCRGFIRSWNTRAPGLYDVGAMPGARRVYSNGDVRLYRIDTDVTTAGEPTVEEVAHDDGPPTEEPAAGTT